MLEKIRKDWNEKEKDYLLKILSYYDQMLLSKKEPLIIDTNRLTPEDVLKKFEQIITDLSGYSFRKIEKSPPTQMNLARFLK